MSKDNQQQPTNLEEFLVQAMKERDMSMAALARAAGLSKQAVFTYMNGARPTLESCRKLAFYLNEPISKIISLSYKDVDSRRLQSLIETYLELPEMQKHTAEDMMQVMLREARRTAQEQEQE